MKKTLFLAFLILILVSSLCGVSLLNSKAQETSRRETVLYYKSLFKMAVAVNSIV